MREIKFRGKRLDNGEWVYGFYYHSTINNRNYIADLVDTRAEEIIPETVGQYTRLKDKNGKEIYEGDIVRCWGGEYCQGYWEFDEIIIIKDLTRDCFMMGERGNIQVIGNIHDNPELLKEAK